MKCQLSIIVFLLNVVSKKVVFAQQSQYLQLNGINNAEVNVLNLHFDHCSRPKTFSWENLKCECPAPLIEENGNCVCADCIFEDVKHEFLEGWSENIPRFINDIFEEIHEELEDTKVNDNNETANGNIKNSTLRSNAKNENDDDFPPTSNVTNQHSYHEAVTRPHQVLIEKHSNEDRKSRRAAISSRKPFKRESHQCKTSRNQKKFSTSGFKSGPRKLQLLKLESGHRPQSFSDSVVGGFRTGGIASGADQAKGSVSSYRGTGAISLGAGGGSAGGAAFTGVGQSNMFVGSKGAAASGMSFIGKQGKEGVSTTSLLLGKGDVIAVNSLGKKGSASGVGVSTQMTAGAATSVFGPASASVSAAVGKGQAQSSSSYDKELKTSAGVQGQNGTIVESSAVGNPDQELSQLSGNEPDFVKIPIEFQPYTFDINDFSN